MTATAYHHDAFFGEQQLDPAVLYEEYTAPLIHPVRLSRQCSLPGGVEAQPCLVYKAEHDFEY